ncbi:MAG: hypothetical protein E3J64_09275 [Anaerolineales bacterium]|nr:MAG: hypothetical protein E3J64_09275 [Anaerolineales bacterium]
MTEKPPPAEGGPDEAMLEELLSRLQGGEFARWIDLASAVLLAVAVVASAFSAWQATLWGGVQATSYAEASSKRLQSNAAVTTALTQISYDATSFALGAVEYFEGNQEAVEFFEERLFREEFRPALEAWLATEPLQDPEAPKTPFELPEYKNANLEESQRLTEEAEAKFEEGKEANKNGDDYILATVLFASVLFFAGVTTKFKSPRVRALSLFIATAALAVGMTWLVSLPRLDVFF